MELSYKLWVLVQVRVDDFWKCRVRVLNYLVLQSSTSTSNQCWNLCHFHESESLKKLVRVQKNHEAEKKNCFSSIKFGPNTSGG